MNSKDFIPIMILGVFIILPFGLAVIITIGDLAHKLLHNLFPGIICSPDDDCADDEI